MDYYENCGPGLMWASEAMGPADPFGWEGYLVMLVGQQVPPKKLWNKLTQADRQVWETYRSQLSQRAANGMTVTEAVEKIRSPNWGWKPDFYAKAVRW